MAGLKLKWDSLFHITCCFNRYTMASCSFFKLSYSRIYDLGMNEMLSDFIVLWQDQFPISVGSITQCHQLAEGQGMPLPLYLQVNNFLMCAHTQRERRREISWVLQKRKTSALGAPTGIKSNSECSIKREAHLLILLFPSLPASGSSPTGCMPSSVTPTSVWHEALQPHTNLLTRASLVSLNSQPGGWAWEGSCCSEASCWFRFYCPNPFDLPPKAFPCLLKTVNGTHYHITRERSTNRFSCVLVFSPPPYSSLMWAAEIHIPCFIQTREATTGHASW